MKSISIITIIIIKGSRWPRDLRHGFATAHLLGLRVRISPRAWKSVSCECCVLSDIGLSDGPITRPGMSYRVGMSGCNLETSSIRGLGPLRQSRHEIIIIIIIIAPGTLSTWPHSMCHHPAPSAIDDEVGTPAPLVRRVFVQQNVPVLLWILAML